MQLTFDADTIREIAQPIAAELVSALRDACDPDAPITLSEADAAKRLGMAGHQLRDRRLAGEVTGTKLGGRWYYETAELREYARRNRSDQ